MPNGGVSVARNAGIEVASGNFLSFVDADDALHSRALEAMLEAMEKTGAEVCVTSFARFRTPEAIRRLQNRDLRGKPQVYGYEEAMEKALYQQLLLNNPWGMMIRRDFLGSRRFREGIRYEDLDAFYRFYEGASRIAYLGSPYYLYRDHPQSFINTWSDARLDVLDVTDRMAAFFRSRYPRLTRAAEDRRFSAHFNMLLLMRKNGVSNPAAMKRCRGAIRGGRRRAIADPKVRLKNKLGALASYLFI